jgi:hypothetical protein
VGLYGLERERYALSATNAQRDDASTLASRFHSMQQANGQNRARRSNGMTVRNSAAINIHDVLGQSELFGNDQGNGGESFVDLDPLQVRRGPAGPFKSSVHGSYRPESKEARLNRRPSVRDKSCKGLDVHFLGDVSVCNDHCGRAAV